MNIDERHVCAHCLSPITEGTRCELCGFLESEYAPEPHQLPPETLLQRRYLLASVLGEGGFGVTYAAWDLTLDRAVAVKEYFPSGTAARDCKKTYRVDSLCGGSSRNWFAAGRDRFLREARILATLSNIRGVVPALDCFEENGTAYIVMEFIRGVSLRKLADQFGGKLPAAQLLPMLLPVMEALQTVHSSGLLHRDISPDNILLDREGAAWLIDFGAAEENRPDDTDLSRTVLLRKGYTPLEQYDSHGAQGPWTDVYALSATIYDLLCGQAPPEAVLRTGRDPLVVPNKLGARLTARRQRALLGGLAVHAPARTPSVELLKCRLYGLPLPEEERRRKRTRTRVLAVSAAVLVLGGFAVVNATTGIPTFSGVFFSITKDGVSVRRYAGDDANLTVPERLLGLGVSEVSGGAFANLQTLASVQLPETIRTIGEMAFTGCENLSAVHVPKGAERIGAYAFMGCVNLTNVYVPDSVTSIAGNAFEDCADALTIYGEPGSYAQEYAQEQGLRFCTQSDFAYRISDGGAVVTSYTGDAADVVVPAEMGGYPVRAIGKNVFGSNYTIRSIELPDTLRSIGDSAFYNAFRLQSIRLPEGFLTIGEGAFGSCFALESVYLPSTLTSIGASAFSLCWSLTSIDIPQGVTSLGEYTFVGCDRLESVTLPAALTSIGEAAFAGCPCLSHLRLPDTLRSIDQDAFDGCTSLQTLYVPSTVASIDPSAFGGGADEPLVNSCPKLTIIGSPYTAAQEVAGFCGLKFDDITKWEPARNFYFKRENGGVTILSYAGRKDTVVVPSYIGGLPVLRIGEQAFDSNMSIQRVVLPLLLTQIDSNAFSGCGSLKEIVLPEGLKTIGDHAFYRCAIEDFALPNSVTTVGLEACIENFYLKTLYVGSGMLYWNSYDFDGADALESLTIEAAASIGSSGFPNLRSVRLGNGVYRIESGAFTDCPLLSFVYIPASVTYIAGDAFTVTPLLTIHGPAGSAAETYAKTHGVNFVEEP